MSTRQEKIDACKANMRLAKSKAHSLEQRKTEISGKIQRLQAELTAMNKKQENLRAYYAQQEVSLSKLTNK